MPEKTPRERAEDLISLLLSDWRPSRRQVLWAIRTAMVVTIILLALLFILSFVSLLFDLTVWKLLKVLAVPITIGGAVPLLNWLQKKSELDVENQRAQDAALEAYEDKMDRLILDGELRKSERDSDVRDVARMHTLSVLRRLGPNRKRHVLQFLLDGELIRHVREKTAEGQEAPPIVGLRKADLTGANLANMYLIMANLNGVHLVSADLSDAKLSTAQAGSDAIFKAMRQGVPIEELEQPAAASTLVAANLRGADLRGSRLVGVRLHGANLSGADLRGASITEEQLEQPRTLEGATMPNGQKYEDWRKDR